MEHRYLHVLANLKNQDLGHILHFSTAKLILRLPKSKFRSVALNYAFLNTHSKMLLNFDETFGQKIRQNNGATYLWSLRHALIGQLM